MNPQSTNARRRTSLFSRPKARRLKRGMVSLDESLIAASARPKAFQATQPLTRGLSVPLAPPTREVAPVDGKPFIDRLDPKDVMAAPIVDAALTAILLGLAQLKPEGCRKVVMTRQPSQDVVVRLYRETHNGLIFPSWILACTHRESEAAGAGMDEDQSATADERRTLGMLFCRFVAKALAPALKASSGKPTGARMQDLVRTITGRNLDSVDIEDKDKSWEQLLFAIVNRRPVYATTRDTNPTHQKKRRFAAHAPLTVLEAFELRGERYVCVFDAAGAADGSNPAPKDFLLADILPEVDALFVVR